MKKSQKINEITKNLLVLIATIFIIIFLLEIALRLFFPLPCVLPKGMFIDNKDTCYSLQDNFEGEFHQPEFSNKIMTNKEGFRGDEILSDKEYIVVLGDSFTFGWGVENNETYSQLLENMLESRNFEVINTGIPGLGTSQENSILKKTSEKFHPEYIILGFYINDFKDNLYHKECARIVKDGFLIDNLKKSPLFFKIRVFLNQHSHAYCFIKNSIVNIINKNNLDLSDLDILKKEGTDNPVFNNTKSYIAQLKNMADEEKATLLVILIPPKYTFSDEFDLFLESNGLDSKKYDKFLAYENLKSFFRKNNIDYIDLYDSLTQDDYYKKDAHWNRNGHEKAAEEIYRFIIEQESIS